MFLVLINVFPNCSTFFQVNPFCRWQYYNFNISVKSITNSLNKNLKPLIHRLNVCKVKVNTLKSFYIVFSSGKKILLPSIRLERETRAQTEETKGSGINLHSSLCFKLHINEISHKLSRSVEIFYKLKSFLTEEILKNLNYSLFHRNSTYKKDSWFGASQYMIEKVRVLERKSIRPGFKFPHKDHANYL